MTQTQKTTPITSINQQGHTYTVLQARCEVCYGYILSMTSDPVSGWHHRETGLLKGYLPYAHDAEPIQ